MAVLLCLYVPDRFRECDALTDGVIGRERSAGGRRPQAAHRLRGDSARQITMIPKSSASRAGPSPRSHNKPTNAAFAAAHQQAGPLLQASRPATRGAEAVGECGGRSNAPALESRPRCTYAAAVSRSALDRLGLIQ